MRIATQGQSIEATTTSNEKKVVKVQGNEKSSVVNESVSQPVVEQVATVPGEEQEISKEKLQQVVDAVNDFLETNNSSSKFMYHDGLERYYVMVVNRDTEEVIKEIPPKKLLDAFYEMQKLVGMIVDEKI
ncbi:flagellar protein FlaG [Lysinibacillus parviboronicapiens]|uniref:flagellar protein FlaG n=1 Tax=Lysinibacillus parviboronicapiens TaxID=436516 RepID=UPI001EE6AA04|nr:flagellar protein FlaG [Lysinibacillus parviboronicapiens]